jgi:type IV pilus assembly protein PilZ
MTDVRRAARRVRLPGVQVTYESATGEPQQAMVVDLSREGLYIQSAKPLAVGKRVSLEIQPIGEPTAWSALGRVVWIRDADDGDERPAGMAVKIIDAEDTVVAAIERLLEAREPTERGLGFGDAILPVRPRARSTPPHRENTMLGVGPGATAAPAAPIVIAAPGREPTIVGVGRTEANADSREVSLAFDLIAPRNGPVSAPGAEPAHAAKASEPVEPKAKQPEAPSRSGTEKGAAKRSSVEPPTKRRSRTAPILFVLVAAGGVAGYMFRDRLLAFSHVAVSAITRQPR